MYGICICPGKGVPMLWGWHFGSRPMLGEVLPRGTGARSAANSGPEAQGTSPCASKCVLAPAGATRPASLATRTLEGCIQIEPGVPKSAPRAPKSDPRLAQERTKQPQRAPTTNPDRPKSPEQPPRGRKKQSNMMNICLPRTTTVCCGFCHMIGVEAPPRAAQEWPTVATSNQERAKSSKERAKTGQERTKSGQDEPKSSQE